jgi:ABC-2 type transport system ATP-binding protein
MNTHITVNNLKKVYKIPVRGSGLKAAFVSLFKRTYRNVLAVDEISFSVNPGEMIGFIGPNGAGKTTTLKVLSGLLYPTSGEVNVLGYKPYERKTEFLRKISMVMGNKNQLTWENTILDSFYILKEIYRIPKKEYQKILDDLVDILEIKELLSKMARDLSLGERMKCELVAALLHRPKVLFLDEPTLGLDVSMQLRIREFINQYNKKNESSIILTSHYMADVISLCSRVLLIHKGKLLYDGNLAALSNKIAPYKLVKFTTSESFSGQVNKLHDKYKDSFKLIKKEDLNYIFRIKKEETVPIISNLLKEFTFSDMEINDPPLEAVIDQIYREEVKL